MSIHADRYSHIKVVLSDVLDALEEAKEGVDASVLRSDPDATAGELQRVIGVSSGLARAIKTIENSFGAAQVNPEILDRRY